MSELCWNEEFVIGCLQGSVLVLLRWERDPYGARHVRLRWHAASCYIPVSKDDAFLFSLNHFPVPVVLR